MLEQFHGLHLETCFKDLKILNEIINCKSRSRRRILSRYNGETRSRREGGGATPKYSTIYIVRSDLDVTLQY